MGNKARLFDAAIATLKDVIKVEGGKIEQLQSEEKNPHEYSLGFVNALIFVLSRLEGRRTQPKFYQHKGVVIGKLPKPTHFSTDEFEVEAQSFQEKISDTAREIAAEYFDEKNTFSGDSGSFKEAMEQLRVDIKNFDNFITGIEAKRNDKIREEAADGKRNEP